LACALRIEKIATPILLGNAATIQAKTIELGLDLKDVQIVS
jgi:phosphotransacetylase